MEEDIINIKRRNMAVSKRELDIGTRIERKEHGFCVRISRKIARDHIEEFPKYYTDKKYGLIAAEKKMKRG